MEMLTWITLKCHFKVSFVKDGTAIFSLVKKNEEMKKIVLLHKQVLLPHPLATGSFSWIKTY